MICQQMVEAGFYFKNGVYHTQTEGLAT